MKFIRGAILVKKNDSYSLSEFVFFHFFEKLANGHKIPNKQIKKAA